MYNKYLLAFFIILIFFPLTGQDCNYSLQGKVIDSNTNNPLTSVSVIIQELGKASSTGDDGAFSFSDICEGHYHLFISHIGCDPQEIHLDMDRDTFLTLYLAHTAIGLESIVVTGKRESPTISSTNTIRQQSIEDNLHQDISGLLKDQSGVHILKNGNVSKPVVHGMYGNRLTIFNNGIAQGGQQWGNDHGPEIDPTVADNITVLKGASALEYGGKNLGSIIIVEPKKIGLDPHLHGAVGYSYETNGRGNNLNFQLQKNSDLIGWRINGTVKRYGDRNTPDYFLRNTGTKETNLAVQLEKHVDDNLFLSIYGSTFNTDIGILRGSHIGNLTDLQEAIGRDVPFFTQDTFGSNIEAPRQDVSHHLIKLGSKYYFSDNSSLNLVLAGQLNKRKEFDVRRGNRTDIPTLSLTQYTYTTDLKYLYESDKEWTLTMGVQNILTDNLNDSGTGVLPLIPNYFSWNLGGYATMRREWEKVCAEIGMRYDHELQQVSTLSTNIPREIIRLENNFNNLNSRIGLSYKMDSYQTLSVNTGYATRNPAINELYSMGLHQGVSGIEEGDPDLKVESAIKTTLEYKYQPSSNFSFDALFYFQQFSDYIYLNPEDEFRLTIRGAFPVFKYQQTDATILGFDAASQYSFSETLIAQAKFSYIKGKDLDNNQPLVFIPPSRLYGSLTYRFKNAIRLPKMNLEDVELEMNNNYVFRQNDILPEQDFLETPNAYNLLGLKASSNIILPKVKLRLSIKVDNLLNSRYRDYLNRQRYFADENGRSIVLGLNLKF